MLIDDKYQVVTLCGSTKFKELFNELEFKLTLENKIVLKPGCYAHHDKIHITDEQKKNLDILHLKKIAMSDCIYVINCDNYIGYSTKNEIKYAIENNIPVFYLYYTPLNEYILQ